MGKRHKPEEIIGKLKTFPGSAPPQSSSVSEAGTS